MKILGIQLNSHDTGAAIVVDGKIIAAANEERFSRIKLDGGVPHQSIQSVLGIARLTIADVDVIALADMKPGLGRTWKFLWNQINRLWYTKGGNIKSALNPKTFSRGRLFKNLGVLALQDAWKSASNTKRLLQSFRDLGFRGTIEYVDHDLAHAAGAYYSGGMNDAFVSIVEGSSFTNACSFWIHYHNGMKKVFEVPLPHSPGRYYEVVTQMLGFHPKKHGGKITGLAALGDPNVCYEQVRKLLYIQDGSIRVSPEIYNLQEEYFARGKKMPKLFEGFAREHIAAAFQKRLEDVVCEQLAILGKTHSLRHVVLSGGVFANVKLNMEVSRLPGVERVFVHPGMGDVGQALGAALEVYARRTPTFVPFELHDVYFGPEYSEEEMRKALESHGLKYHKSDRTADEVGELLSQNKVVAHYAGRMEYGPRALGNRSILYPATDHAVNDWLNKRLRRTEFMPFAPVTLFERANDCYIGLERVEHACEFMTMTVQVTEYMKQNMPAAVHVDGTARPQLIRREVNSRYYDILKSYERLTGLPTLINTSFNMHEEPIVCTPEDAVRAFIASQLDVLVLGDYIVKGG